MWRERGEKKKLGVPGAPTPIGSQVRPDYFHKIHPPARSLDRIASARAQEARIHRSACVHSFLPPFTSNPASFSFRRIAAIELGCVLLCHARALSRGLAMLADARARARDFSGMLL